MDISIIATSWAAGRAVSDADFAATGCRFRRQGMVREASAESALLPAVARRRRHARRDHGRGLQPRTEHAGRARPLRLLRRRHRLVPTPASGTLLVEGSSLARRRARGAGERALPGFRGDEAQAWSPCTSSVTSGDVAARATAGRFGPPTRRSWADLLRRGPDAVTQTSVDRAPPWISTVARIVGMPTGAGARAPRDAMGSDLFVQRCGARRPGPANERWLWENLREAAEDLGALAHTILL